MYCNLHTHSSYSNASVGFPDSINSVKQIVERAQQLQYCGVALTDHEIMSGHIEMYKLQKEYPDLKLILGNEIYCMTEQQFIDKRDNNGNADYYHLILIALDLIGWRQLCKLSTFAWENSFNKRGSLRRITTKEYLEEVVSENPGHIICSSACMGGEVSKLLMADKTHEAELVVKNFQRIFGKENFYMEIQPNDKDTHQWESNKRVIRLAKSLKVPLIATTDAHMLDKTERLAHAAAKNSKYSEDAEGEDFYATAYLMSEDELRKYLRNNLTDKDIDKVFQNTVDICNRVSNYDGILHNQIIPEIPTEYIPKFKIEHRFKEWYDKYPYIKKFSEKDYLQEQYAFYQIEQGLIKRILNTEKKNKIEKYLERINHELDIVAAIDENLGTKIITYYSTYTFMIDEIWKLGSVVAVGRGSACSWLINFIMGANQIDPLDSPMQDMLFPERHLNKLRFELPD